MSLVYTVIQHGFRKQKGLTNNDYVLCDMISFLSKKIDSKVPGWCYMSRETMANELGLSKRTVISMINDMIDKKLIEKHEITGYLKSTLEWEKVYYPQGAEIAHPMQEVFTSGAEVAPNNIYNNKLSTKVDKREKKINKFIPPSEQEVVDYFKEKGYSEESAKKAFEFYETGEWKDSRGTPVKNWKQKMISVWFKEENKSKEVKQNKLVF